MVEVTTGAGAEAAFLEARSLVAAYDHPKVLDGFDLSMRAGQASAVLGHNGAVKTTALRCMAGLKDISSGKVRLAGQDVSTLAAPARAQLGLTLVVDAGSGAFPDLTVDQNLAVVNSHLKSRRERDIVLEELVELHKAFKVLAERRGALASSLSGGQRQLLARTTRDSSAKGVAPRRRGRGRTVTSDEGAGDSASDGSRRGAIGQGLTAEQGR